MVLMAIIGLLAAAAAGIWYWATTTGSAATLEWIDAGFSRSRAVELVAGAAYGDHAAQRVELWQPVGGGDAGKPLIVFYHGGGWHSGAPEDYRFIARTFGELGYPVALAGYRLVPDGRYPAMLEDSAAALGAIRRLAAAHGLPADRVVLIGHSAGAYNAVMLALEPRWLAAAGVPESVVAGAIGLAGPYDFYPFTSDSGRNAFGHLPDPEVSQPINHLRADTPPLLLLTGDADTVVRPRNSRALEAALTRLGAPVTRQEFAGMGHAGIIMQLSHAFRRDGSVLAAIERFLAQVPRAPAASPPVQRRTGQ